MKKFMNLNVPERNKNQTRRLQVGLCLSADCMNISDAHSDCCNHCLFSKQNPPQFAQWLQQRNAAPDFKKAAENFRGWWANNFGDFDPELNEQLLCLDNDFETAIAKAEATK